MKRFTETELAKELRQQYIKNPPEGMTSDEVLDMSDDDLLDMDYPVRLPFAPTTRWQGIIMPILLLPTAPPTACADIRDIPFSFAISFAISP